MKRLVTITALVLVLAGAIAAHAGSRQAPLKGEGEGLKIVANIPYTGGTDFETITRKGRDYAITGSVGEDGGMRIIDITTPDEPELVSYLPCKMSQADIQISHDEKTAIMAADGAPGPEGCIMIGQAGFMTVDITDLTDPKPIGVAAIPRGSHNTTAHPTKPYVWNSDSDLGRAGEIQIWSIKNPAKPKLVNTVPVVGNSPHDIAFSENGRLAVTASVTHIDLFDAGDPADPTLLFKTQCPTCSITHDVKFTPDASHVIAGDEAGGGAAFPCPGGAVHFYAVEEAYGAAALVYTGVYEPQEVVVAREGQTAPSSCTSHVMDVSRDGTKLAVSWYSAGTRYLDITTMIGATVGSQTVGQGVKELGWFMPDGGTSWASKFHRGPWIYSSDLGRGFDVFKIQK